MMNSTTKSTIHQRLAVAFTLYFLAAGAAAVAQPPAPAPQALETTSSPAGMEVLTRGPVHEAFAEPVTFDPQPGIVVPKEPPPAIEEVPPGEKPAGDVIWIPGYWGWDDERKDFIWVSGIWRQAPPGLRWVPGYWRKADNGNQWVSGFWSKEGEQSVQYLSQPPTSLEVGPSTESPSPDHFWVPGSWVWYETRYVWRPGYWSLAQPGWVWTPANYSWTPSGYVFNDGYWDYPLDDRGCLFAPVYAPLSYWSAQPRYVPNVLVNVDGLFANFFVRPHYCHYYFGDYFAPAYASSGFYPWWGYGHRSYRYDPLFAYYHHHHHNDPSWENHLHDHYWALRNNAAARPFHTFAQQERARHNQTAFGSRPVLATSLADARRSHHFEPLGAQRRSEIDRSASLLRQLRDTRSVQERRGAADRRLPLATRDRSGLTLPSSQRPEGSQRRFDPRTEASRSALSPFAGRNPTRSELDWRRPATEPGRPPGALNARTPGSRGPTALPTERERTGVRPGTALPPSVIRESPLRGADAHRWRDGGTPARPREPLATPPSSGRRTESGGVRDFTMPPWRGGSSNFARERGASMPPLRGPTATPSLPRETVRPAQPQFRARDMTMPPLRGSAAGPAGPPSVPHALARPSVAPAPGRSSAGYDGRGSIPHWSGGGREGGRRAGEGNDDHGRHGR